MKSIFLIIKTFCILYIISPFILKFVVAFFPDGSFEFYYCSKLIIIYILAVIWTYYLKRVNKIKFSSEKIIETANYKMLLILTLMWGIGFSLFQTLMYLFPFFNVKVPFGFSYESFYKLYNTFPMILSTTLIIPIIEELLFRGVIQQLLTKYLGWKKGILIGALLFAFFHGQSAIFVFVFFCFIGVLYFENPNIFYPIIAHISVNLTNVIVTSIGAFDSKKNIYFMIVIGLCFICFSLIIWNKIKNIRGDRIWMRNIKNLI